MEVGAIIILEAEWGNADGSAPRASGKDGVGRQSGLGGFLRGPIEFVELLGQSLLERTVQQFCDANFKTTLVLHPKALGVTPQFRRVPEDLKVVVAEDVWSAALSVLSTYSNMGIDCAALTISNAYAEADLLDLMSFHCSGGQAVTRASDPQGPLDLWVVNSNGDHRRVVGEWRAALSSRDVDSYFIQQYVKRLGSADDFRQLVADSLMSRCSLRPVGSQLRPGVWVDAGVQIRSGARVVGPAYLGRNSIVGEGALITRSSNIESGSHIDYGTAVEDTSVLSDTYVGMWLDVRHSLVYANRLLNIERDVLVEVSDPNLVRSNVAGDKAALRPEAAEMADKAPVRRSLNEHHAFGRNMQVINTTAEFES